VFCAAHEHWRREALSDHSVAVLVTLSVFRRIVSSLVLDVHSVGCDENVGFWFAIPMNSSLAQYLRFLQLVSVKWAAVGGDCD